MKKITKFCILLLVPLLVLTACGGEKRPTLDDRIGQLDVERTSYEGVLEALDSIDIYQQGTHQLNTEDDGIIILQSPSIDLNRYLGEKVLVKGQTQKGFANAADVFTVKEISFVDEKMNQGRKDYESQSFGFRFSYPENWGLNEGSSDVQLKTGQQEIVTLSVFSDKEDLDAFASSRAEGESSEVTIGAQRSLRFVAGDELSFYVPNPPKKKIYLIHFKPSVNTFDEPEIASQEREAFYNLLESFELMYTGALQGDVCGGLQQKECPEDQICQLEDDSKYAEGVCVPVGGEASSVTCPYIAPPANCEEYRISQYSVRGCPSRYECVDTGSGDEQVSFRDLNVVDAGMQPDEPGVSAGDVDGGEALPDYKVPDVDRVTYEYSNTRAGFSILMPNNWYYASFGPIGGSDWKVGFADTALEEESEAIIYLNYFKGELGDAGMTQYRQTKQIGDAYFRVEGPADLSEVIDVMTESIKLIEE